MKVAFFARYRDAPLDVVSLDGWRSDHTELLRAAPELRRYVQNAVVSSIDADGIGARGVEFDAYSCAWLASGDDIGSPSPSAEWGAVYDDLAEMFALRRGMSVVVEERVMRDDPIGASSFKVVWVVRFRRAGDREAQRRYWTEHHAVLALRSPEIRRYVQNHVVGSFGASGVGHGATVFDGFSECWFDDRAAFERATASQVWKDLDDDAAGLFDLAAIWSGWSAVLDEAVLVG